MNNNIKPIKKISFIPIHRLHTFLPIGDEVEIGFLSIGEIPFKKGTATYSINRSPKKGGTLYEIAINCSVKPMNVPRLPGIVLLERCDGSTLVIGDPEIPIFASEITNLESQSFSVSTECGHFPYLLKS